jgi:hypothetical protein
VRPPGGSGSGQKKIIAPVKPSPPTIGRPLTAMSCSVPSSERMRVFACAGRLALSDLVISCSSSGIGSPVAGSNGPNVLSHSSALSWALPSKRRPSSAPAASL